MSRAESTPIALAMSQSIRDVGPLSPADEIRQRGDVTAHDLSARVHDALEAHLSDEDHHLIQHVHVFEGWGEILFVDVASGIRRSKAGLGLEEAVEKVVREVLHPRRFSIRIIWGP